MKNSNFVSVVIATRNRSQWLENTIGSLTKQTRLPDEIIIVDNASTDDTRAVVHKLQKKLPLRYIYEAKKGIPYARNCGVQAASGDLIVFIDDDAIADENWLKNIEIPFIRDPNIGAVGGLIKPYPTCSSKIEKFYVENMLLL